MLLFTMMFLKLDMLKSKIIFMQPQSCILPLQKTRRPQINMKYVKAMDLGFLFMIFLLVKKPLKFAVMADLSSV